MKVNDSNSYFFHYKNPGINIMVARGFQYKLL
jgi:hypothetical protein